jgi:hypothetical protein
MMKLLVVMAVALVLPTRVVAQTRELSGTVAATSGARIANGSGLVNFDFSLVKNNYVKKISDAFKVQFRAEFFNVLNHANFAPPLDNRNIFGASGALTSNGGLITAT